MAKATLATVKSFVRKHRDNGLMVWSKSRFDGLTDGVESTSELGFTPATARTYFDRETGGFVATDATDRNHLGLNGIWLVGESRDMITPISRDGFVGFEVYNCCGCFEVAIKA